MLVKMKPPTYDAPISWIIAIERNPLEGVLSIPTPASNMTDKQ